MRKVAATTAFLAGAFVGSLLAGAVSEGRPPRPGRCGQGLPGSARLAGESARIGLVSCTLDVGHAGMHRDDVMGANWGRRRVGFRGGYPRSAGGRRDVRAL